MNQARAEARTLSLALSRVRTSTPREISRCGLGSGVFYCNYPVGLPIWGLRDSASEPRVWRAGYVESALPLTQKVSCDKTATVQISRSGKHETHHLIEKRLASKRRSPLEFLRAPGCYWMQHNRLRPGRTSDERKNAVPVSSGRTASRLPANTVAQQANVTLVRSGVYTPSHQGRRYRETA